MKHSEKSHEVQCSICDKTFLHPRLMRKHKRIVHVDSSHECTQCSSKVKVEQQIPDQAEEMRFLVAAK